MFWPPAQGLRALRERGKMVLLVTGKCDKKCYYCPLSSEKRGKDVFFANERRVESPDELVDEARLMNALGTGITGGDPLLEVEKTVASIKALKKRFGKSHHIHLYTTQTDGKKIRKVANAGLDEIRFHPPLAMWGQLEGSPFENAVSLSKKLGLDVGLELPVIPGRESDLIAAIRFADKNMLDFVNLNELEFSETNWRALRTLDFDVRDDVSSGVEGSERLAHDLLRLDTDVPLHYCSASFKDGVQLRRRIMRRARKCQEALRDPDKGRHFPEGHNRDQRPVDDRGLDTEQVRCARGANPGRPQEDEARDSSVGARGDRRRARHARLHNRRVSYR